MTGNKYEEFVTAQFYFLKCHVFFIFLSFFVMLLWSVSVVRVVRYHADPFAAILSTALLVIDMRAWNRRYDAYFRD